MSSQADLCATGFRIAAAAAVLAAGLAFRGSIASEHAIGSLTGRVVLAENGKPLAGVMVWAYPGAEWARSRFSTTNARGEFRFPTVAAGKVSLRADSESHGIESVDITVSEGGVAQVQLALKRTHPNLSTGQHPRVFSTHDDPYTQVEGYLDPRGNGRAEKLEVTLRHARLAQVYGTPGGQAAAEGTANSWESRGQLPAILRSIPVSDTRSEAITEDDAEGYFRQTVSFGKLAPGFYALEIQHGKDVTRDVIHVTDLALVTKLADDQVTAFVVHQDRGTPLAGARVASLDNGRVVAGGVTDASGICTYTVPSAPHSGGTEGNRRCVIASLGDQEASTSAGWYYFENGGRYRMHAYTDRTIYRPGQSISFKSIVRRMAAGDLRYEVPAGLPVGVEVRSPDGDRMYQANYTTDSFGAFSGTFTLSEAAPRGSYTLVASVAGERHTTDITVASYRKPEAKLTVTPVRKRVTAGEPAEFTMEGSTYFGTPLAGMEVTYYTSTDEDWWTSLADDPDADRKNESPSDWIPRAQRGYGDYVPGTKIRLDGRGRAVVRIYTKPAEADSFAPERTLTLSASGVDDAGRSASGEAEVSLAQGDFRLTTDAEGMLARPGQPTNVLATARTPEGAPVAGTSVRIELCTEKSGEGDKVTVAAVAGATGSTGADGRCMVPITPPRAGSYRIRARAVDPHGRTIQANAFLYAARDNGADLDTEYADLVLYTDKRRYRAGETARVLIGAERTGQVALLSIEGERVYRTWTVPIERRSTVINLPVPEEYGPNVLVSACYVKNRKFATSEATLRVTVPERKLDVKVTPSSVRLHPGDPISYTVVARDSHGRPVSADLSLSVVDESIYALREEDPGAILETFYPRRSNSVRTEYSFSTMLMGDGDKAEPDIKARSRFLDTAWWKADLRTDAQGRATASFRLPDNLTTWRATAVAQTMASQFGWGMATSTAAKALMVRLDTPRYLVTGDQSRILALVHNETGAAQSVHVRLKVEGLWVTGEQRRDLRLAAGQVGRVEWPVSAPTEGMAKLRATAWTDATEGRPYTDGVEQRLEVKPYGREMMETWSGDLQPGQFAQRTFTIDSAAGARLAIRITPSALSAMGPGLQYLVTYPYDCTEQTSSRLSAVVLAERLRNLAGREAVAAIWSPEVMRLVDRAPGLVRAGILRLGALHHDTGGWGWWRYDADDPWLTGCALEAMARARDAGYEVLPSRLRAASEAVASDVKKSDPAMRAYLSYVLSLAGDNAAAADARKRLLYEKLDARSLAYLAILDKRLRLPSTAWAQLSAKLRVAGDVACWQCASGDVGATALGLRAMLRYNPTDARLPAILLWLMRSRTGDYWVSTRDTLEVVTALAELMATHPAMRGSEGGLRVRVNGVQAAAFDSLAGQSREQELLVQVPARLLHKGSNQVSLERGPGTGLATFSARFQWTASGSPIREVRSPEGIRVTRQYLVMQPRPGENGPVYQGVDSGGKFKAGDVVMVRLKVESHAAVPFLVIEDPIPPGLEVSEAGEVDYWTAWYSDSDVKDDRIAYFCRTLPARPSIIEYYLRAQTPGSYRTMPATVQGMYSPATRAECAGGLVEVLP